MWYFTKDRLPNDRRLVEATTPNGDVTRLKYHNNLWWTSDMVMYVYYTPVKWRYV